MAKLDRSKYIEILRNQNLEAALTALHHDKEAHEFETFEGPEGYQPQKWNEIKEYTEFSRELWNLGLTQG